MVEHLGIILHWTRLEVYEIYFLCYSLDYTKRREIKNIVLSKKIKTKKCKLKKVCGIDL